MSQKVTINRREEVIAAIEDLDIPNDSLIVIGEAACVLAGISESTDVIEVIVTKEAFRDYVGMGGGMAVGHLYKETPVVVGSIMGNQLAPYDFDKALDWSAVGTHPKRIHEMVLRAQRARNARIVVKDPI